MPSRSRRSSSATASSSAFSAPGRPRRRGSAAGFSLLEVVVALAILGISLGVIFQGIGQGLRLRGEAAESVRLALVAERVLGGIPEREAAPDEPEEGEDEGIRWRLEPVAAPGPATRPGALAGGHGAPLVVVRLTVTAPSGRAWEMSTLLPRKEELVP